MAPMAFFIFNYSAIYINSINGLNNCVVDATLILVKVLC